MGAYAKTRAVQFPAKTTLAVSFETACVAARISYASLCTFRLTLQRAGTYAHRSNFYQRDLTKGRALVRAVALVECVRSRPHPNFYGRKPAYGQSIPRTPTYQLFGLEKGDAGAQYSVKGLPFPDGFGSFRGARRSTRARDQAWGPTERCRTAGANNKARTAAASDGAFRGAPMGRRDVIESPRRAR